MSSSVSASPATPTPSAPLSSMSQNAPKCPTPEKSISRDDQIDPKTSLSPRQLAALHLLAHGHSDTQIASHLSLTRKTIHRWRNQPAFAEALSNLLLHLADSSTDRFLHLLNRSLNIFKHQLKDPHPLTSLRAARALLSMAPIGASVNYRPPRPPKQPPLSTTTPKNRSNSYLRPEHSHGRT